MTRRTITRDDGTTVSAADFDPREEAEADEAHRRRLARHLDTGHRVGTCSVCAPGWGNNSGQEA